MNDEREFEGKDLEQAVAAAAAELGVAPEDLHYEMVEQGRRGLLGLGVKNVRIRVQRPLDAEEPPAAGRPARPPRAAAPAPETEPTAEAAARPATATAVGETVGRMISLMGLDLEVHCVAQDGDVDLQLEGADQQRLLARNAELLSALQLLLNRMARRSWPGVERINVGCDGHARPRDEELAAVARRAAEQVARTGKTKQLRPMNAYERRIVHLTVREFGGLTSSSEGAGPLRRVRVAKVQNRI